MSGTCRDERRFLLPSIRLCHQMRAGPGVSSSSGSSNSSSNSSDSSSDFTTTKTVGTIIAIINTYTIT